MSNHTPGPWAAHFYPDDHAMIDGILYVSSGDACVSHANARLIAAAPDMLEALEMIAESDTYMGETSILELQRFARAVIAKAKGEEE